MALKRLQSEYKSICKDINMCYSIFPIDDNLFKWNFIVVGPPDTIYEGGIFNGYIVFSLEYPITPPSVYFNNIIHPNVYEDGKVCISILHEGVDNMGHEKPCERWTPSYTVDSIMVSIVSILSSPNFESPANVKYSILWKNNPVEYKKMIYHLVAKTQ